MVARGIFIALVIAGIAVVWRGRDSAGGRASKRLLLLAFAALVIVTIMFPQLTSRVAAGIGIGRGSDLVFYLTSFALMFLAALVYLEFRKLEDRIAEVTRALALHESALGRGCGCSQEVPSGGSPTPDD